MDLTGKCVLITGANGGLGTSVTRAFLDAGATVIGSSRSIHESEFGHERFFAHSASVSTAAEAEDVVARVVGRTGEIDALVHLVGGFTGGASAEQESESAYRQMFDLNFFSALYFVRAVLPAMRRRQWGRILVVGSRTALDPAPGLSAYSASKAALVSLLRTVALENKEFGITANAVLPGAMDTPANRSANPAADSSRWVDPRQVASALVYLASDSAAQMTGALLPVYGKEA